MASVRKNPNGPSGWVIDYYDLRGYRKRRVVRCTEEEAKMLALEIEVKKSRIKLGFETATMENIVINDAVKSYFKFKHVIPKTAKRESLVYRHLIDFIGDISITKITPIMIDEYLKKRKFDDNIKDATLGVEYRTLKAFFNYLVEHDYLNESPMKKIKHPKVKKKPVRFLTVDEINRLMQAVDDNDYRDLIMIYITTGARGTEILRENFTWENVDFEAKSISIHGKGDKYRSVPMNEISYKIFYQRRYVENHHVPFNYTYDMVYKKIKLYYKAVGIKNANLHTLRKTFGSIMAQDNVSLYTISKLMGHSATSVTENAYTDLVDKNLRDGVSIFDKIKFK